MVFTCISSFGANLLCYLGAKQRVNALLFQDTSVYSWQAENESTSIFKRISIARCYDIQVDFYNRNFFILTRLNCSSSELDGLC